MFRTRLIRFFFFNDTATTEIYTLSLHDALPICQRSISNEIGPPADRDQQPCVREGLVLPDHGVFDHVRAERVEEKIDRKSTRLNSSHSQISYAVFCLKKKT